ncbi:NUDIX domain-containing protein [Candidatus Woesearchaeota archaeon]|nr:NUDIX domain-containing protein [Candidatus Woesearchaeota archaeon]
MEAMVDVVDKNDNPIGQILESHVHRNADVITRAINIFIYNRKGELLLQKRSRNMFRYPLHWTSSVSGSVNQGEEPADAALRELKEELGIEAKKEDVKLLFKKYVEHDIKHVVYAYRMVVDEVKDISNQEVVEVRFFPIAKVREMIRSKDNISPFFTTLFKAAHGHD